jgi:predicted ATPase
MAGLSEAEREALAERHQQVACLVPSLSIKSSLPLADDPLEGFALAVARLLVDMARERPVLLALGNLEHSDRDSLDLLRYLAHLAVGHRWLLVGALADEQPGRRRGLRRLIDAMIRVRVCEEVRLDCLCRQDSDQLVRAMLAGNRVDDELLAAIHAQSRGNPLFVRELVQEMRDRERLILSNGCWHRRTGGEAPVPRRVRGLVAARLAEVDETTRRVLALAAAADAADVSLRQMRIGAAALDPPVSDSALFAALDRALQMRVLEERGSAYAFRHPLVRAALFEDLPRHRRDQLQAAHGRARTNSSHRLRVAPRG